MQCSRCGWHGPTQDFAGGLCVECWDKVDGPEVWNGHGNTSNVRGVPDKVVEPKLQRDYDYRRKKRKEKRSAAKSP